MLWRAIINTSANDSFNASETTSKLCSAASRYCLYFKAIGDDGNTFYLVTDDIRADSVVWIANRDEPIYDAAAALFLSDHGVLDIIHPDGKLIKRLYSLGTEDDASNTVASLLDTGNFVIEQVNKDGSKTLLWQSFDTPTDTMLPGMTLGVHNKTGQKLSIVSYFLDKAPAPGAFALEWDPNGEQLIIRRKDKVYWASGVLRGNKFDNIPEEVQDMFDYEINDGSISFIARNEHYYYAPWKLSSEGVLFDSLGNVIARADKCYGNNYDGGCQAWETPVCRHVDEKFDEISAAVEHADYINGSADQAASSTTSDCKAACWNNCDCVGFTNLYDNGTGCYFVYGTLQNIGNGSDIFHKLVRTATFPPSLYPPNKKDRKGTWKKHTILHMENFSGHENSIENQETRLNGHDFRQFSFASIMEATNSFSSTNKLGEGGFGPVYKAWELWKEGQALELIDPAIHDSVVQHQVLRSIHIGLLCAEECAVDRPTILEILSMLTNSHEILLLPKKPAFYCGERVNAIDRSPKHIKTDSISLMSITDFSAR
ncbi:hypothetical protein RIF29_38636 [Crotalaria pallida]|uniref:Uncharacterized protein n=1 Tax=Crotalaria pallida TaxID=3830 RepID=A0AAN9HNY4_CROPI